MIPSGSLAPDQFVRLAPRFYSGIFAHDYLVLAKKNVGGERRGHVHFPIVVEIGNEMSLLCIAVTWLAIHT